jgi:hypothetical protein
MTAAVTRLYHFALRAKQAIANAVLVVKTRINAIMEAILDSIVVWLCKRYQRSFEY